jgi:hypothetical protein
MLTVKERSNCDRNEVRQLSNESRNFTSSNGLSRGSNDNLALVRFSQVALQNGHQLIWTRRFGCLCGMK